LLFSAILIPVLLSPQTVTAVNLEDEKFKLVVTFEINKNPNTLRSDYATQVRPIIEQEYADIGTEYFDVVQTGDDRNPYSYNAKIKLAEIVEHGFNPNGDYVYQIYPLVRVSGDNPNLTDTQWNMAKNTALAVTRTAIVDMLQSEGAYNVQTYVHFSYGAMRINEGF